MKQLFGAVCAMVIALGGLATAPAQAQQHNYRDHEGWYGAPGAAMQVAARPAVVAAAAAAA
ncbi:MAG: hypothetical protein JWM80_4672, partial [Cyanobacteria bacterium RYN_339]|nr:hypothetical protein [Cyanobacteria bacterium RYN_339]